MQAHGFRVFFTPLLEVLFTFPSRYWSTIGLSVVFSLAGWSPPIPAEFLVFRGTQVPAGALVRISGTGLSPAAATLSCVFPYPSERALAPVLQPRARPQDRPGLGCCAFARHYLRNHFCFLFLRVLRCFSSPRSPHAHKARCRDRSRRVPPFGHQRAFAPPRGFSQLVTSFVASESHRHPPCALLCFLCFFRSQDLLLVFARVSRFFIASSCYLLSQFFLCSTCSQHVNELIFSVVPGRLELPTSTLSV